MKRFSAFLTLFLVTELAFRGGALAPSAPPYGYASGACVYFCVIYICILILL